jgi:hypothetical protein
MVVDLEMEGTQNGGSERKTKWKGNTKWRKNLKRRENVMR